MRAITCTLLQNTGGPASGNSLSISTNLVSVGTLDVAIDTQLTKMQPGDLTVELVDPDDSIWEFLQSQLAISGGLLPPWLQLSVGGVQKFLGTVDPSRIVRHLSADRNSIELGAQDWSVQLSNVYLGVPSAPLWMAATAYVVSDQVLSSNGNVYQCVTAGTSAASGSGPNGQTSCTDGTAVWQWVKPTWVRPVPKLAQDRPATSAMTGYSTWSGQLYWQWNPYTGGEWGNGASEVLFAGPPNQVGVGDVLTSSATGDYKYTVLRVQSPPDGNVFGGPWSNPWPAGTNTQVTLSDRPWVTHIITSITQIFTDQFTRLASSYTDANYFTVRTAVGTADNVYTIQLDTVDGLMALDVIRCIHGTQAASWTVLSVDPELNRVTTKEEVKNLSVGDKIYFDSDTNAELVMTDAEMLIRAAAQPYAVDLSRFVKATLPIPVFGWLASQSLASTTTLMPVSDVEPTLTGVRLISGLTNAYHGDPDGGWTAETSTSSPTRQPRFADWTNQVHTAPASIMPHTLREDSIYARQRNRAYHDFTRPGMDNGPTPTAGDPSTWVDPWTTTTGGTIPLQICYDYLTTPPRKIVVGTGGGNVTSYPWTGTAWGAGSAIAWPVSQQLASISNFPGGPSGALLGLSLTGALTLALAGGGSATCMVPDYLVPAVLVPTPYGPYVVGATGYAKVRYVEGVLTVTGAPLTGSGSCLWPNTFVARSATEAVVMGRLDVSQNSSGAVATESWLYRLTLPPDTSTPDASVILCEKIADGAPVFAGAILDPSKPGRVVGHYGGRPWQYDTQMPWTVERFTPSGMTAQECVEHVCQLNNAIAVPQPSGVLAIVSRGVVEEPVGLAPLVTSIDQTLSWPNFFSIVRCSTQDGSAYYDAYGAQNGGNLLEISSQPMLWTLSQTAAMAESYASWYGQPRATESHSWTFADPDQTPPWEGLEPFARVTVNGSGPWRVMSISQDFVNGTANVSLVSDPS